MVSSTGGSNEPLVSVILTTRDRPRLLPVALACYRHQKYPRRELVVVDDGAAFPADAEAVAAADGRLILVEPGTPLGTKLNRGVQEARGSLCQKMDDDDWYAPQFLETMVAALLASSTVVCRPTFAFLTPFLLFDVARWEVRRSVENTVPGATLLFARDDWKECPFRALTRDESLQFVLDQVKVGVSPLPVQAPEVFLAVRHRGLTGDWGHTWTRRSNDQSVEEYLRDRPLHNRRPEALLPAWALAVYRDLRRNLVAAGAP